jgi:large subunit ribosomal protein L25
MAQKIVEAELRTDTGKNVARRIRQAGRVPGILYGDMREAFSLTLNPKQLSAVLRSESGQNTIFNLQVSGGETTPVMIVDTQFEPVRGHLLHADLKRIAMDKKLKVSVHVVLTGESPGVKLQGGILEVVLREVEVECLPTDIPEQLQIGIETLEMGHYIRVADLQKTTEGKIQILSDPDGVICHVVAPKAEEVKPEEEEAAEAAEEPELIKKGKAAEEGEEQPESK